MEGRKSERRDHGVEPGKLLVPLSTYPQFCPSVIATSKGVEKDDVPVPFVPGDRVRLIKAVPVRNVPGPPIGAIGTVIVRELPGTPTQPPVWRVAFDDFSERFYAGSPPGIWFVHADEIERLAREGE